jgi:hypothetical protein
MPILLQETNAVHNYIFSDIFVYNYHCSLILLGCLRSICKQDSSRQNVLQLHYISFGGMHMRHHQTALCPLWWHACETSPNRILSVLVACM